MDKEQAYKIGLAFKLGMIYARGKAHARKLATDSKLAFDEPKWITVHPNGKENKGRPALLDSETGEVLGGMGGKFNGKHISIANSKSNKPALLNNQQVSTLGLKKEDDNKINEFKSTNQKPAENNTVKEAKSDKETPKAQQTNKISLSMEDAIDPTKFKEYNKNVKKEFNKLVKKNQTDKEDFKNFVENMDLDPKFKDIVFEKIEEKPKDLIKSNGEHFNPHNNFWVKSPKDIDLNQEVQSYMYFLPSSQTSKMIEDMTEAEKNELKEVIFNENNEKKLKWLQIEPNQNNKIYHTAKIDLQNKYRNELSGANSSNAQNKGAVNNQPAENIRTQNKSLNTVKDNGLVASVLNMPDASRWNNKIYTYQNGEKAVFINNEKIVLNDEQYKKLKELAEK